MRSKGDVDVRAVAVDFGGGGHKNAAGFTVAGKVPEVRGAIIDKLAAEIERASAAQAGMSKNGLRPFGPASQEWIRPWQPRCLNGVLVVDKPQGPTSHDVVAGAPGAHTRRIGHTGTLDPLATGVLPLVIGQATRLAQFLPAPRKGYDAGIRLGVATETYDAEGEARQKRRSYDEVVRLTDEAIATALAEFRGSFAQTPPPYSAKKVDGVRAYALARRQIEVRAEPVPVSVHELDAGGAPRRPAAGSRGASAGFYVRSLAHDLGQRLGCGAHLAALRRHRSGAFTLEDAITIEELRGGAAAAGLYLIPMERLLGDLPVLDLSTQARYGRATATRLGPADARPREGSIPPGWRALPALLRRRAPGGGGQRAAGGFLHPVVVLG